MIETNFLLVLGVWTTKCLNYVSGICTMPCPWVQLPDGAWGLCVIQLLVDGKGPLKQSTEIRMHIHPAHLTNTLSAYYWIP